MSTFDVVAGIFVVYFCSNWLNYRMYVFSNMSNECIKISIWKYNHLTIVCKITRKFCKAVTVTDSVFTHGKLCIKLYIVNLEARDNSYET